MAILGLPVEVAFLLLEVVHVDLGDFTWTWKSPTGKTPQSTLLMTTSAFAGHELTMEAYQEAIKEKYRFFAYGDALLVM